MSAVYPVCLALRLNSARTAVPQNASMMPSEYTHKSVKVPPADVDKKALPQRKTLHLGEPNLL